MKNQHRIMKMILGLVVIAVVAAGVLVLTHKTDSGAISVKALSVTSAPAGVIGASAPDAAGQMWLLVNSNGKANAQLKNGTSPKSELTFPVSTAASSIASQFSSNVAVGLATASTGAVEFYSVVTLRKTATTPLSGPVVSVLAGGSSNYFALVRTGTTSSVAEINAAHQVSDTIPMPAGTVSFAVSPDDWTIYGLQDSGNISVVDVASQKVTQIFSTSKAAHQIALSPDGTTLYELKGTSVNDNVAVIDVGTETQKYVLPAPASCVAIEVATSGASLLDVVGTAQFGNVQVFPTAK